MPKKKELINLTPPRLVVFKDFSFGKRLRDENGQFATVPRYIGRIDQPAREINDQSWIRVDIIGPVAPFTSADLAEMCGDSDINIDQIIRTYSVGHFYSPRRIE
jgi:hypothetical protein